jgi:PAS domain S-box-containing protein
MLQVLTKNRKDEIRRSKLDMLSHRRPYRAAEARLRVVEEKLKAGTWIFDFETSEVIWSEGLFKLFGLDPNTVVPTLDLFKSLIHPDDRLVHASFNEMADDSRIRDRKFRLIRPDGRLLHVHNLAEPHFDRGGRLTLLFGIAIDISATEHFRSGLQAQQQVTEILRELAAGSVWRADRDGKLKDLEHWSRLTGQTFEEARDWSRLAAIHPDDHAHFRDAWQRATDNAREFQSRIRVRLKNGRYVTVAARGLPIRDEGGEVMEWVGFSEIIGPSNYDEMDMQPAQIRAARALLDWSGPELAERAGISFSTLRRMEKAVDSVQIDNVAKVRNALIENGIAFHDDGSGRLGVSFIVGR